MKTTNYYNTFIEVADDCPAQRAEVPPRAAAPGAAAVAAATAVAAASAAAIQFDMIAEGPYAHTSDDVIFRVHQLRHGVSDEDAPAEREAFFAKGQPCLRGSALGKRYGWGVHSDEQGRVALYARESERYAQLAADPQIAHLKAFRNKRG